jgi:hypothetical protein
MPAPPPLACAVARHYYDFATQREAKVWSSPKAVTSIWHYHGGPNCTLDDCATIYNIDPSEIHPCSVVNTSDTFTPFLGWIKVRLFVLAFCFFLRASI